LLQKTLGNFTKDTELTFEFDLKYKEDVLGKEDINPKMYYQEKLPI